ncbi:Spy0128 family protein, partial [Streptococcus infantis]|uniref:Spy0128 family protein n=1 Tax=Streptococcus infantis TaxID=68892 RepID=UPI0005F35A63
MIRREQQRFSLRKYKVGVTSVFLGTTLSFMMANGSAVNAAEIVAKQNAENTELVGNKDDKEKLKEPSTDVVTSANSETSEVKPETSIPEVKSEEVKSEETKAEKAEEKTSVIPEAKPESSKPVAETASKEEVVTTKPKAEEKTESKSEDKSEPKSELSAVAEATSLDTTASAANVEAKPLVDTETLALAAENTVNAGALATNGGRRRNRRAATDHNTEAIATSATLKDGEVADPDMSDPAGATVKSQNVPAGYERKAGDYYTFSILDLTKFNERYNTNYYVRIYKNFSDSTDSVAELIDKTTGAVVETKTITATSGVQQFTTTATKSNSELTFQIDYQAGKGTAGDKTDEPFLQVGYKVGDSITSLVAPGHTLTPDEQARYTAVYNARTSTDVMNVVEPAYNGRTITDSNFKLPKVVAKTTYYKVVDKSNSTYKANKTDTTVQDYVANGNEVELAKYTLTATEGQNFTASGERKFAGYKLYQKADTDSMTGYASRPYTVGSKFMDADRYGIKRIKEIVGEDGTVVIRVYLLDPRQQSKRSDGTLETDGYMLLAETKPIKPGNANTEDLVVKKTPLNTIAFTDKDGVYYPNGKEIEFGFQTAAGYTPKKTVFVPFLGDNIGYAISNEQLVKGIFSSGINVDLLNSLTPYKSTVYYYEKVEPVTYTPEVSKVLEGRTLNDGDFNFTLKQEGGTHQETVANKNGKATFSELTFEKPGTYTYKITEVAGSDTNVDYDGMEVTLTVTVTQNAQDKLEVQAVYTSTGGHAEGENDKVFNNYVVAPVKTKFDFSKKLDGRKLKDGEFTFALKDSTGKTIQTKTNNAAGVISFDDLTFDNTQVGTHKYTVEEVIPTNKVSGLPTKEEGMTYDTMKAEVTITVTKEGHVLKATNTLPADTEFNNTFTPSPVKVNLEFDKSLSNGNLNAGDFSFTLTGDNNVNETVTNKANGKINFSELSFDQAGVYNYTVKEVKGNKADVDYDAMTIAVKVTVTKDENTGLLVANTEMTSTGGEATGTDDKVFNNHVVAPVTAQFDFSKALAGRKLKAGEFSFVLKDKDGTVIQTKQNDAAGNVKFDALTFTNAQVGDHNYTVEEVIPETKEAGMTYDTMKANVTVTVTKSGHALTAVAALPADKEFNNTFTPTATQAQFKFTKKLEGKELTKDAFTFELVENGKVIQTKKNAADGTIQFDAISYDKEGTHTYTVREVAGTDTNIDYDSMNAEVTVTVTKDAASGLLNAAVTMPDDTEFNNYHVAPVVARFDFTKKLAGRELKDGEFSFVLKDSTGQTLETVTNKADGTVTFTELSFDNTKVGTHTYTVEEVIPSTKELGMTYDTMKATVTVEVAKNGHTLTTVTNVTSTGGVNADGTSTEGTDDKEFNNKITPPETPEFQPEKFVLNKEKFDITGSKLVDDDDELTDEYTATNANPYADGTSNNEAENINTKTVERGDKLVYQVWLDTKNFTDKNNIQSVGISDTYDSEKLTVNAADIKAYDSETGDDVTDKFDIKVENGVITATSKTSVNKSLGDVDNTQVIDTTKFAFGRYYKFDIPATVKDDVAGGVDIENKANQIVHVYNPVSKSVEKPEKPTQKRVNSVPITAEFNFTKRLEGRELKAGEFTFELKDSDNIVIATATNDADGKIKFSPVEYTNKAGEKVTALKYKKGQEGTYTYFVTEVKGTDATVTYDTMKAEVTVTVSHDGTAKALVANVTEPADKEFNNVVTPPEEPKFQPEKYVVSEEKFDITGDKLVDDDKELADKYADTNANPYADKTDNNEAQNLNTKTVKRGDKLVYQVWLDTTKFDAANKDNIQSVGISDDYDEAKLELDSTKIKAYDSVTGAEVTDKFDITVNNGVITATLKAGFTKSLGDAEDTQIIDTTKFAFGRYYKFDIPTTVKADVPGGVDIENTATQVVNYYNPTTKKVEKPEKPTEKRVNNVPVEVEFNFTKRLEGRELKANEFSFVLKDSEGKTLETVSNDAAGNVKFKALEFKKGQEGVHNYTVEEVKGTDATVTYDTMKANVTVTVKHDGTAKVLIATVGDIADKEFNNVVTPPEEPKFQPEKYVVSEEKFDITGDKL